MERIPLTADEKAVLWNRFNQLNSEAEALFWSVVNSHKTPTDNQSKRFAELRSTADWNLRLLAQGNIHALQLPPLRNG